jgi:uncharacterized membrane protein
VISEQLSTKPDIRDAEVEEILERLSRSQRPIPKLPAWLPLALTVLPYVLITVTIINGLIGVIAILTPLLAANAWTGLTDGIYSVYSFICPQRPDHTFFIAGHPMAFEQRDLSMYLGFAAAGLLYVRFSFIRRPLSHTWLVAGLAPMLIDVFISTIGLLPSTAISRTWTGALASFVIVWWSYPRFASMFDDVMRHVKRVRDRIDAAQPTSDCFVLPKGDEAEPANECM